MHNETIPEVEKKSSLYLLDKLRDQFKESFDLIIHHEWMIDLLNSKLSLEQFESFITQEAHIYDFLARKVLNFAINNSLDDYDELMRSGIFFYSESLESLRPLDDEYVLSCPTKSYCEDLDKIWNGSLYPHKLLTLIFPLWIREGVCHLLKSEDTYIHHFKVWTERILNNSHQELISSLGRIMRQSFIKTYGSNEKTSFYEEGFKDLEHLLSSLMQFELSVCNHSYQINFNQVQQSNQH